MDANPTARKHEELLAQLGWMAAFARRLALDPDVADDVLQRTCLLALEKPPRRASAGPALRAWLATTLRRLAGHTSRSEARRARHEQIAAKPEALPATTDLAARREILRKLVEAVTALPEPLFTTIVRRYYEGLSAADIAALDGVSAEAVRQRLARARVRLRRHLEATIGRNGHWLAAIAPVVAVRRVDRASRIIRSYGGVIMARQGSAAVALKLVATAAVVAVIWLTAWSLLDDQQTTALPGTRLAQEPDVIHSEDLRLEPIGEPQTALPPPKPLVADTAPSPSSAPAASAPVFTASTSGTVWDQLWDTTDALVDGTVSIDDIATVANSLLAHLDVSELQAAADGTAIVGIPLLDDRNVGRATLSVCPTPGGENGTALGVEFTIRAELRTRSGYYTGYPQDREETTKLDLGFTVDESGQLDRCSAIAQNSYGHSRQLFTQMAGRDPVPIGGVLSVGEGRTEWRQVTLEATTHDAVSGTSLDPQSVSFTQRLVDPETRPGSVTDPGLASVAQALTVARSGGAR